MAPMSMSCRCLGLSWYMLKTPGDLNFCSNPGFRVLGFTVLGLGV